MIAHTRHTGLRTYARAHALTTHAEHTLDSDQKRLGGDARGHVRSINCSRHTPTPRCQECRLGSDSQMALARRG